MGSLSFLAPLALVLGALAVPIILLYMLRLRRIELPISSTFLWQQLVRDREANAPWQRLRPSWLLFIQLLILAALVLALARPFTTIQTITAGRIVLLLDGSASMQARDVSPDRFARAQAIALDIVDTLGADDTMTVIEVSSVPEVLAAASRDKLVLRNAIQDAEPGDVSADWDAALTLAAAGAVGVDELQVVIIGDGGLPPDLPPVPGDVRFVPVGESDSNLAITALATSSLPGRDPQLFARINNYSSVDTDVIFDGRINGSEVISWAYRYTIPARGYVDIFDITLPPDFETLTAHITLPGSASLEDELALDDAAYTVRDRSGAGRVLLVTADNLFLQQVLRSLRGVTLFQITPEQGLPQQDFDLYVFDGWLPDTLPDGDLLIINPPSGAEFFDLGAPVQSPGAITARVEDERTRNVGPYLSEVDLREYRRVTGADWGAPLLYADDEPIVLAGEIDDRQVVLMPFDVRYPNTDLVLQPAWPILMAELAAWYSPPRITDVRSSLPPGAPVSIRFVEDSDRAIITHPDGDETVIRPQRAEEVFADTFTPGLYRVRLLSNEVPVAEETFAVNLFDAAESDIAPRDQVTIGTVTVSRNAREETARREYWPWVAGVGFALLMLEWWFYHRRLQRMPALSGFGNAAVGRWGRGRAGLRRWLGRRTRVPRIRR